MISGRSFTKRRDRTWPLTEPCGATLCIGMPLLVFSTDVYSQELTRKVCYNLPHDDTPWPKDFVFGKRNLCFTESKTLAKSRKITLWNWRIFRTLKYLLACSLLPIGATWLTDRIRLLYFEKTRSRVYGEWPVLYRVGDVEGTLRRQQWVICWAMNSRSCPPVDMRGTQIFQGTHRGFLPLFEKHTEQYCHFLLLRMGFCKEVTPWCDVR